MGTKLPVIEADQRGGNLHLAVKMPSYGYLESLMRANCFHELIELFKKAHAPAKELTESYSAFNHLRQTLRKDKFYRVLHIGDGAHARTAAMFAFLTKNTYNIAIDPACNEDVLREWRDAHNVQRFSWIKDKVENVPELFNSELPTLVTFVHAHVDVDEVLEKYIRNWEVAYSSVCCYPSRQKSNKYRILDEGADWRLLSEKREYQVISSVTLQE